MINQYIKIWTILILLGQTQYSFSDTKSAAKNHIGIGIELSSWKPSSLDLKPTSIFNGVPGTSLSYGFIFSIQWLENFALRISCLEWTQNDLEDKADVEKVRLRPICVDLKNNILGNTSLSPYVSYGVLFIWAAEKLIGQNQIKEKKGQFGYGASVGAGLDLKLSKQWTTGIEYQYWYAKLSSSIGLTADYSGPKISVKVIFVF